VVTGDDDLPPVPDSGNLLHNLLLFGRLLRGLGLDVNPGRMIDLVQALAHIEIGRREDFYHASRSLLVHNKSDIPLFDHAFDLFWRRPPDGSIEFRMDDLLASPPSADEPQLVAPSLSDQESPPSDPEAEEPEEQVIELTQTFSAREILRQKDFADLTGDELQTVKEMISHLVWQLGQRRTRRLHPGRGAAFDLRRSLRRNLRYGGELLEWPRRKPKLRPRPLVVIADISGSMERYTRLLLHFFYSLSEGLEQAVEVFLFSTRLTRVSRQLRGRNLEKVMREVAQAVPDWSGGTRIGDALKRFNYDWARRVLGRGAVVLLISDGWDRGDPILVGEEMARLQRSCYRLVWLNPLLGSPRYEPLTRGIQAALPYIDDFRPVHNLASLEDLADQLLRLNDRRPIRRQQRAAIRHRNRPVPRRP
jgi:uncharacterized protein with von Willebrand factor type A (vWA) domain